MLDSTHDPSSLPKSCASVNLPEPKPPRSFAIQLLGRAGFLGLAAFATTASSIVVLPAIVRFGGPRAAGYAGLATLLATAVGLLSSLGFGQMIARDLSAKVLGFDEAAGLIRFRLLMFLPAAASVAVVACVAPLGVVRFGFFAYAEGLLLNQLADTAWSVNRAKGKSHIEALTSISVNAAIAAVATFGILKWHGLSLQVAGITYCAGYGATALIASIRALENTRGHWRFRKLSQEAGRMRRRALPYLASDVMGLAYLRGDVALLSAMAGIGAAGYYVSATTFLTPIVQVGSMMGIGVVTLIANNGGSRERRLTVAAGCMLGVVSAGTLIAAGPTVARVFYGSHATEEVTTCIRIMALFALLRLPNFAFSAVLVAHGRSVARLNIVMGMIVVNVALNVMLDPHYGAIGSAWATVVTEIIATLTFWSVLRQRIDKGVVSLLMLTALFCSIIFLLTDAREAPVIALLALAAAAGAYAAMVYRTRMALRAA